MSENERWHAVSRTGLARMGFASLAGRLFGAGRDPSTSADALVEAAPIASRCDAPRTGGFIVLVCPKERS